MYNDTFWGETRRCKCPCPNVFRPVARVSALKTTELSEKGTGGRDTKIEAEHRRRSLIRADIMIVVRRRFAPHDRLLMMCMLSNVRARACVRMRARGAREARQQTHVHSMPVCAYANARMYSDTF